MKIIDTHCDALLKLWESNGGLNFTNSNEIDTNYERLNKGKVTVQCFAIFVDPAIKFEQKFQVVLEQIDYFHRSVLAKHPEMKHIKKWKEIFSLKEGEIGAILTLEGVDAIGDDLVKLRILFELGVMSVGLTWNFANLCADGVGETRGAGLTNLGKQLVKLNNEYKVLTDVSHLNEPGFWDVMELADYPIATHSNAKSLCSHQRNLNDVQVKALVAKKGLIGIVFHPVFLNDNGQGTMTDIIKHIDYLCGLGAKEHICFGSDFDGISVYVPELEHAGKYQNLINELLKHFKEDDIKGFAYQNFLQFVPK
ncbi:dipeptidase [Bacillus sp. FJAT-45350]|uniref:dipeptidase n=1 Tax=Bacillus sp. FJAT-45350 TaxID=2011014 RepID=UPI000BB7A835|nr:dipeptidase [Bacillus sp. FJAT-45350]